MQQITHHHSKSTYKFFTQDTRKLMLCCQAKTDDLLFSFCKQEIIDQNKEDHLTNISWVDMGVMGTLKTLYFKVHYDRSGDALILLLTTEQNTYAKTTQLQYFQDILDVQTVFLSL